MGSSGIIQQRPVLRLCTLAILCASTLACAIASATTPLNLCVDDTVSFNTVVGEPITDNPTMQRVIRSANRLGLTTSVARLPWKRCLAYVASGQLDAVAFVTAATPLRALLRYPQLANGEIDTQRALEIETTMLYRRRGEAQTLVHGQFVPPHLNVGVRAGRVAIVNDIKAAGGVVVENAEGDDNLFRMLLAKRVDLVATFDWPSAHPAIALPSSGKIEPVPEPLAAYSVYLAFNPIYYRRHAPSIEALWDESAHAARASDERARQPRH